MKKSEFENISNKTSENIFTEYWGFLKENKKWWLLPILLTFLFFGILIILSGSGAAPFIYTLF